LNAWEIEYGEGSWNDSRDLNSSADFWAWFIVGTWEGSNDPLELHRDADGDPDNCFTLLMPPLPRDGAESPALGLTDPPDGNSVLFLQAIADDDACVAGSDEAHTMVHEIGHAHSNHADYGIMTEGAPKNQNDFSAKSLQKFRATPVW